MLMLKQLLLSNWFRNITVLLLIGVLVPNNSAFAKNLAQWSETFAKPWPPNKVISQSPVSSENVIPLAGGNYLQDPSFEASFGNSTFWTQSSTNYGSPLCTVA